jgi:hypothetical protein
VKQKEISDFLKNGLYVVYKAQKTVDEIIDQVAYPSVLQNIFQYRTDSTEKQDKGGSM